MNTKYDKQCCELADVLVAHMGIKQQVDRSDAHSEIYNALQNFAVAISHHTKNEALAAK